MAGGRVRRAGCGLPKANADAFFRGVFGTATITFYSAYGHSACALGRYGTGMHFRETPQACLDVDINSAIVLQNY
jgi:hypothetical protein